MHAKMLAEQLVGEARARRPRLMDRRERHVLSISAASYAIAAIAIAMLVDSGRDVDPLLVVGLVIGYAVVAQVRFEFGNGYVSPEQLVWIPLLLLAPLQLVPALMPVAALGASLPDLVGGSWSRDRWLSPLGDSWPVLGPVLVLALLDPTEVSAVHAPVYALAFAAQLAGDLAWSVTRDRLIDGIPVRTTARNWTGVARVEFALTPVAFVISIAAADEPAALLAVAPLVWLLGIFSRERQERYSAALELQRAYRGTVMLLSDVVEFEDRYTADHSRSVVDLVHAVADELGVSLEERQELEFAALLHDVGKIAIPKEILNKPAALTRDEFEVIKTHTIEGQFMLDRVGGLLGRVGEIVRSCHERWDGDGYPDGLAGEEIPLAARIVFTCDAYNAMTTNRPYRAAMSREEAMAELSRHSGTQFDPHVVDALLRVVEHGEPALAPVDGIRAVLASRPVQSQPA